MAAGQQHLSTMEQWVPALFRHTHKNVGSTIHILPLFSHYHTDWKLVAITCWRANFDQNWQKRRLIASKHGYTVENAGFKIFIHELHHGYTQCVLVRNTVCKNNSNLLVHSSIDTRSFRHCRWKSRISTSIGAFHIAAIESWYCYKKVEIVSRSISGALVWGWKHHCL